MSKKKSPPQAGRPAPQLVVLVADKDTQFAVDGLLGRPEALGIRRGVVHVSLTHPQHDPGCARTSPGLLAPHLRLGVRHVLVVFDREGAGCDPQGREQMEADVERQLAAAGWGDRAAAVVIDPELENWVWSRSPHVAAVLGWGDRTPGLRDWLVAQRLLANLREPKPARPKEAMDAVLRHVRRSRSSAIYRGLAEQVSVEGCTDPAFVKFRDMLRAWFPAG